MSFFVNPPDLNKLPLPLEEEDDDRYQFTLPNSIPREEKLENSSLPCRNHHHDQQQEFYRREDEYGAKWIPSKMRWIRRSMVSDQTDDASRHAGRVIHGLQDQEKQHKDNSSNSLTGVIRVCSDCNTTKTPLWRSGPCGPKSLCNACGIRQRKARRALAAAASVGGLIANKLPKQVKNKRRDKDSSLPYKKRCKNFSAMTSQKKNRTDDIIISMRNSALHQAFPQDEKDAAILLMALSCGFIHG